MRVATYSRVSTSHHAQNPDVQVHELRRYCEARGWQVIHELVDHGYSGGTDNRPGLKQLMALARSRKIDVVVVTKLDRAARSLRHLVSMLDEFKAIGIQFVSIGDQIDMTTAAGKLMLHIVAAFGEFERGLIRERTMAGLAHARAKGKRLGRPEKHDPERIRHLRAQGLSYQQIQKETGAPATCISRALWGTNKTLRRAG